MLGFFKKEPVAPLISNVENLLREGSDLLSNDTIVLNEELAGNLFCSGEVVVGCDGELLGSITSEVCTISGTIQGDISATQKLEIKSTAVVNGNIKAPMLNIEEGAVINGRIAVVQESAAAKVELNNKLNRHTAAEYLSAKQKPQISHVEEARNTEKQQEAKPLYGTLKAAEKHETVIEKPQIVQKDLSAAVPQPGAVDNAEANNRWW